MKLKRSCRPKLDADIVSKIEECAKHGLSSRQTAAKLGLPRSTIQRYWQNAKPKTEGGVSRKECRDECVVEFGLRKTIVTLEDAVQHARVDLEKWYVDRWEATSWEMGYKDAAKEAHTLPLYRVKIYLKRIIPRHLQDASDALYERLAKIAPSYGMIQFPKRTGHPLMMTVDLSDAHLGNLGWRREVGEDCDLSIIVNDYRNAVKDIVGQAAGFNIDQVVLPVGNDFYHYDNYMETTTAGTPQDTDGRYAKMIEIGEFAVLEAIDFLMRIAPVKVLWVPGNHDRHASYHLCRTIKAWFRNTPHVDVDVEPMTRKIHQYGRTVVGYMHGDKVNEHKVKNLPDLLKQMAIKAGVDLREIRCLEWHLGHIHTAKMYMTKDLDTLSGTTIRWLHALTGTNAWHFENGYCGNRRAAESFLYDREEGYIGQFLSPVRSANRNR